VIFDIVVQPNSSSDLRHEQHLNNHNCKINEKDNVELVGKAAYLEFILALIQNLFGIVSSVNH